MSTSQIPDPMALIGSQAVQPLRPELSYDLLSRYGLSSIRDSVARYDPKTGEKINPLRKSYNGYPPKLGLAGKNKAVKHRPELGESFSMLARLPEEAWDQKVGKAQVAKGFLGVDGAEHYKSSEGLKSMLERALTFKPAKLPPLIEGDWSAALGHEKARQPKTKNNPANKPSAVGSAPIAKTHVTASSAATPAARPTSPAINRPQRKTAGQKRAYDDEVGEHDNLYPDGFSDGNSSDGESRASQHKKQKRAQNNQPPPPPTSYNPASIHQRH